MKQPSQIIFIAFALLFSCNKKRINKIIPQSAELEITTDADSKELSAHKKNPVKVNKIDKENIVQESMDEIFQNGEVLPKKEKQAKREKQVAVIPLLEKTTTNNFLSEMVLTRLYAKHDLYYQEFDLKLSAILEKFEYLSLDKKMNFYMLSNELAHLENQILNLDEQYQKNLSAISFQIKNDSLNVKSYTHQSKTFSVFHKSERLKEILSLLIFGELNHFKIDKKNFDELPDNTKKEIFIYNYDRYINKSFFEEILSEVIEICEEESEEFQSSHCNGYKEGIFDKKTLMATETLSYIINTLAKKCNKEFEEISVGVKNFLGLERSLSLYIVKGNKLEKSFKDRKIKAVEFREFLVQRVFYSSK